MPAVVVVLSGGSGRTVLTTPSKNTRRLNGPVGQRLCYGQQLPLGDPGWAVYGKRRVGTSKASKTPRVRQPTTLAFLAPICSCQHRNTELASEGAGKKNSPWCHVVMSMAYLGGGCTVAITVTVTVARPILCFSLQTMVRGCWRLQMTWLREAAAKTVGVRQHRQTTTQRCCSCRSLPLQLSSTRAGYQARLHGRWIAAPPRAGRSVGL
mmetsp:Transcript_60311/g.116297  ORF Transcript_60311/g.116297 Transcript_60311/m.116297 type:complete len:209 (+) Transcript_60311:250-876(+)